MEKDKERIELLNELLKAHKEILRNIAHTLNGHYAFGEYFTYNEEEIKEATLCIIENVEECKKLLEVNK